MGKTFPSLVTIKQRYALQAVAAMNEDIYEKIEEVEEKVDQSLSTWEKLNEDSRFKNLSGRTKVLIWELAKIKENDSPKSQAYLAEQYDVSSAYLSQLKTTMEHFT
jgi:uncharacterized protein (DUF2344 family)